MKKVNSEKDLFILLKSPFETNTNVLLRFIIFEGFGVVLYTFTALFGW